MKNNIFFNDIDASEDEIWDWYIAEYKNTNPITQVLLNNFFRSISKCVKKLGISDKLIEIGCGPGVSSKKIFQMLHGQTLEVSEFDQRLVNKLKKSNFPFQVRQESVLDLHREDQAFDCVILLEVLEHLENYQKALDELFRVSKKYVILSVPNEPLWSILNMCRGKYLPTSGNTPGHLNKWSKKTLQELLSKYGEIVLIETPIPWIVIMVRKFGQ